MLSSVALMATSACLLTKSNTFSYKTINGWTLTVLTVTTSNPHSRHSKYLHPGFCPANIEPQRRRCTRDGIRFRFSGIRPIWTPSSSIRVVVARLLRRIWQCWKRHPVIGLDWWRRCFQTIHFVRQQWGGSKEFRRNLRDRNLNFNR